MSSKSNRRIASRDVNAILAAMGAEDEEENTLRKIREGPKNEIDYEEEPERKSGVRQFYKKLDLEEEIEDETGEAHDP